MADDTYQPKVYRKDGGDTQVIASGGVIEFEEGGKLSPPTQELTVSGPVTAGVQSVELKHATTSIAATIATAVSHPGLLIVKSTTAHTDSPADEHTLTLTIGTFDGTNNVATLNALNDALVVYFDSAGNGTIIENVGSVALS